MKAIYLGPKREKKVWHNYGDDADGSVYEFHRGIPREVPLSLANFLNSAPNFRLDDGTAFISDPILKKAHDDGRPITILLIRYLGGIGDILMVTPAIRGVREKFPNAEITFAINKQYAAGSLFDIIEFNPHIDKIVNTHGLTIEQKKSYTSWTDLSHPCARYEAQTAPNVDLHRSEIYCEECGVTPSSMKPVLVLPEQDMEFAHDFYNRHGLYGSKVVAIQPYAADLRRVWGPDRMLAVAGLMSDVKFLWIDYLNKPVNPPENVIDCTRLKVRQTAALVKKSNLAVGCDSFLLQISAALDVPLIAIFGATDPYMRCKFHTNWTPIWHKDECSDCPCWYGYPCLNTHLKDLGNLVVIDRDGHELTKRKCLETVTVPEVADTIRKMLDKREVSNEKTGDRIGEQSTAGA